MQDLITHCLHYLPNQRPCAQEVFDRLCVPEFLSLKRAVQMAPDCNMETIAVRVRGGGIERQCVGGWVEERWTEGKSGE